MKLVSNATTLVSTALLGLSIHEAAGVPAMRDLMLRSGQEALDVGAALGHPVLPIFGLKDADVAKQTGWSRRYSTCCSPDSRYQPQRRPCCRTG